MKLIFYESIRDKQFKLLTVTIISHCGLFTPHLLRKRTKDNKYRHQYSRPNRTNKTCDRAIIQSSILFLKS